MYSRGYGGIESDGVLHEMERRRSAEGQEPPEALPPAKPAGMFGRLGGMFSKISIEDLLLIGIALLLLFDGSPDNDILIIVLAFLLLF